MDQKKVGIYALRNKINNFLYIDSSKNLDSTRKNTYKKLNDGEHKNNRLQRIWNEQNFEFEILEEVFDDSSLSERKKHWINHHRSNEVQHGYNMEVLKRPWEEERSERLKEKTWGVQGDIRKILYGIIQQLDYTLEYAEQRKDHLNGVLSDEDMKWLVSYVSSPLFIDKQKKNKSDFLSENDLSLVGLSRITDYLVFPKFMNPENEFRDNEIKLRKSKINMAYGNDDKEILFPDSAAIDEYIYGIASEADEGENKANLKDSKKQTLYKFEKKQKIKQWDIDNNEFIAQVYSDVNRLEKYVEKNKDVLSSRDLSILGRIISKLKDDAIIIKEQTLGTIYFKRITKGSTEFNYDQDTGYFDDRAINGQMVQGDYIPVSENKLGFGNEKHVLELLNHYVELKQRYHDKVDSDMWHIIMAFEELIDATPLERSVKDILVWRIDGYGNDEIAEELKKKYGIVLDGDRISKIYNDTIPRMIVEQYRQSKEDWMYTYKVSGKYKTCSKCSEVKLQKHFGKDSRNKDGLQGMCKKCDSYRKSMQKT